MFKLNVNIILKRYDVHESLLYAVLCNIYQNVYNFNLIYFINIE